MVLCEFLIIRYNPTVFHTILLILAKIHAMISSLALVFSIRADEANGFNLHEKERSSFEDDFQISIATQNSPNGRSRMLSSLQLIARSHSHSSLFIVFLEQRQTCAQ